MAVILIRVRPRNTSRIYARAGVEEIVVEDASFGEGVVVNRVFAGGGEVGCCSGCGVGFGCAGGVEGLGPEAEGEDARN